MHIHIHYHGDDEIKQQLHLIIKNQKKMSEVLDQIKADLATANEKADAIAADVQSLHDQIAALGDAPTAEQLQEVKDASAALVAKLGTIDDATT